MREIKVKFVCDFGDGVVISEPVTIDHILFGYGIAHDLGLDFKDGGFVRFKDLEKSDIIEVIRCIYIKDKNGKEIYEGDILKIWCGGDLQNNYYCVDSIEDFYCDINDSDSYMRITNYERIGNKYKNPELKEVFDKT